MVSETRTLACVPGFVDLQVNGFRGVDFSDPKLTEDAFAAACRALPAEGTAAFLPTMITAPAAVYEHNLPLMARVAAREEFRGRILGFHLEGPFISAAPGAVGAHNPRAVRPPDPAFFDRLWDLAGGRVKLITIAADPPGAEDLARRARERGAAVSIGHSLFGGADLDRLARVGAGLLTHLGNGVPNVLPRHENPIVLGLANDAYTAMLITDGHHLPAGMLKVMLRAKGAGRVIVTSDQCPMAGLPPGRYQTPDNLIVIEENGRLHNPEKGCLVGSSATMLRCMNHLSSLEILTFAELMAVGFDNPLRVIGVDPRVVPGGGLISYDPTARRFALSA